MIHGGGEHDFAGPEPRAPIKENVALGKILTARPDMTARGGLGHGDDPVGRYRVLLNDDGIRAFRHRRAGKDPHRFAGTNLTAEAGSRRSLANHREARRQCRHIRGAHRIAIHGRGVEGRLRQARGEILGEHAAERVRERHAFGFERIEPVRDAGESFSDGEQRHEQSAGNRLEGSGAAAGLLDQANAGEGHAAVDGLAHIVEGETSDRDRCQRLHLDPGLAFDLGGGLDADAGRIARRREVDGHLREGEGMAKRNKLMRFASPP